MFCAQIWTPLRKPGQNQISRNAHLWMPYIQKSTLSTFLSHFWTLSREHGFMGLENLAGAGTVLGGPISAFLGQLGPF